MFRLMVEWIVNRLPDLVQALIAEHTNLLSWLHDEALMKVCPVCQPVDGMQAIYPHHAETCEKGHALQPVFVQWSDILVQV